MTRCVVDKARAALELVHDPAVHALKFARPSTAAAAAELRRRCRAVLRHAWKLVADAYRVSPANAWAVHLPGTPLNCVALVPTREAAEEVSAWWPGHPLQVSHVPSSPVPEQHIAMGVALHWTPPAWLATVTATTAAAPAAVAAAVADVAAG